MKRNAFTLVELIFTILIIGVLAAVAIPRYQNLRQNAEVKAVIKTTMDTASSAATAAVNQMDLENNTTISLTDLVTVTGRGWSNSADNNTTMFRTASGIVASIRLNGRSVRYGIDCDNFVDARSQDRCYDDLNRTVADGDLNVTINF